MIELINATKYYQTNFGKKFILKDVTLTIPSNKNIAILGENGSGKSTFIKLLAGIDHPNNGTIKSNKIFSWPVGIKGGFQMNMTGRQNVKFVCRIYGESEEQVIDAINFVKEFSELGNYFDMPIKNYSNGMKSRLSFGLSLFFDFDYLLIDEILSVGDKDFRKKAKNALLKKIKKSNAIIVSRSTKTLIDLCDVAIYLKDGKLKYFENVEEAIACYQK